MKKYNTEQRKLLLNFLKEHSDIQFSIEEITTVLCGTENISASSVYRNIKEMISEGVVARFSVQEKRRFLYQYIGDEQCRKHIHMKCEGCGQLIHLDDSAMQQIMSSIENSKAFILDIQKTILYGKCEQCA